MLTNAPESEAITLEDQTIFDNARSAIVSLKKTFESWMTIGKGVVRAREIADRRGGAKTFMRLIEQQGLASIVNKATASNLLRIMERYADVVRWHESLTDRQRIDWAAPTTIIKRCPIFCNPSLADDGNRMTPAERDRQALAAALERIADLERELSQRQDGDTFDYRTTPAKQIAKTVIGNLQPYPGKGRDFLREAQAELERLRAEARRRR
jgi:hypothetical protein